MRRLFLSAAVLAVFEAGGSPADRLARVDAAGVLRWCDTAGEVALLGVNTTRPLRSTLPRWAGWAPTTAR